jgi:RNase P protein component
LILNEELAIGKEFEIVFEGPAKTLKLHASVVRIRPTENGQFQVGVSFAKNVGVGELSHFVRA